MQKPVANLTLRAEDGEALIAQVHRSHLPRADAERVEWVIRMYFYVVFALQEAKLSVKRLRALLFGKNPTPSPVPEASSASRHGDGEGTNAAGVFEADTGGGAAPVPHAPAGELPPPERATPKGGHRPGTGRLEAAAYVGATRAQGRHEERAVGQRCPVCGQGTL